MVEAYIIEFEESSQKTLDNIGYIMDSDRDFLVLENRIPVAHIDDRITSLKRDQSLRKLFKRINNPEMDILSEREKRPKEIDTIRYNGFKKVAEEAEGYLKNNSLLLIKKYGLNRDLYTTKIDDRIKVDLDRGYVDKEIFIRSL